MQPAYQRTYGEFDIGDGPTQPDEFIMRTGRVSPDAYTSAERFEAERALFRRTWLRVAQTNEIPNPGDWIVREIEIAPASVIIVRHKDGQIRAFHNVCTHRNLKLLWEDKGCSHLFVCPYHAWSFRTDGGLQQIPDRRNFPDVDVATSGLTPIAVDVFCGLVFINLDPLSRQTLRAFLGGIGDLLDGARLADYKFSFRLSGILNANWKGGLEASSEGYHVRALHKLSAKDMCCSPERPFNDNISERFLGPHRHFSNPCNPNFRSPTHRRVLNFTHEALPGVTVPGVTAIGQASGSSWPQGINPMRAADWGLEIVSIFPNLQLNLKRNSFYLMQYWPIAVDRFRWEAEQFYVSGPVSRAQEFAISSNAVMLRDISAEDTGAIEKQCLGLKSRARPFIQFGEQEMMCRHQMAVMEAAIAPKIKTGIKVAAG